ncbi:hypothetical protein [Leptospira sp. GIMC2001]|uniref:hypothetical protein n=1 Tax=Leptospira sp. GIMC2001 TaxID=1513297 RepID=UPI00234ACA7E|nr:hypothetical protein [Leptospira sp. GIMC2001]WCL48761.1 hypothetical protein O4O04_15845 [Leptospira sp. GIMC2001]
MKKSIIARVSFLLTICIFAIMQFNCYNYLSDDLPIIAAPKLDKRIPVLSITVSTPESEKKREKIAEIYRTYLEETKYFGRVIEGGVRAPYHIDIYTAVVDEYENTWLAVISGLFSIPTATLLPAYYGERRIVRARIFRDDEFLGEKFYSQKHTTLYSLIFMFIWETGIEESAVIENNKEKNIMHNLVQDMTGY